MPKYLVEGSYTAEGLQGLRKDQASGREAALRKAIASLGGKLESMHYTLGDRDVIVICDLPDHVSVAALALTASSSGLVRTRTTTLLTVAEADAALGMGARYRAPGAKKNAKQK